MTTTMISLSSSRASWCPVCHVVPLACWVVRGSGAVGVAAVVLRSRSHSLRSHMLGAGRRLPVVALFGCGCQRVRQLSSSWAARVVCGGVGHVTWHAGDLEGTRVVVDVAMWLSRLCGCHVCLAGGCRGLWVAGVVGGGGGCLWVTWW